MRRYIDFGKRWLAIALGRQAYRMTRRQKKGFLVFFCLLGTLFFSSQLYEGLLHPRLIRSNHPQHIRMPVPLPPPDSTHRKK